MFSKRKVTRDELIEGDIITIAMPMQEAKTYKGRVFFMPGKSFPLIESVGKEDFEYPLPIFEDDEIWLISRE